MQKLKILVLVKTRPLPSRKYKELVCTAGVTEDGHWIRLYPIDFRYRPYWQWYNKYQWIEVEIKKNPTDPRPESYHPNCATIRPRSIVGTENKWAKRKEIVLRAGVYSMKRLHDFQATQGTSLGIVKPAEVTDFTIEQYDADWKPEWRRLFLQYKLFGQAQKPLEKVPYKFSYQFRCNDTRCRGHTMMIEDWEIDQLFFRMRNQYSERVALDKVREKFLGTLCGPEIDAHFFVGTVLTYGTWVVLGVFWPPKLPPSLAL